ncbi:hypothetical protein B4135_1126 [Caldibacillus debilis]|uniref:Uncharacterized protein n=1 Tax=Caldibacillus debilis TaxID=301148 RepID=A0A150MDW4_9BACI|nr:hypothetical protein B4135_1126 [Caldibacillus debilis]
MGKGKVEWRREASGGRGRGIGREFAETGGISCGNKTGGAVSRPPFAASFSIKAQRLWSRSVPGFAYPFRRIPSGLRSPHARNGTPSAALP